MNHVYTIIMHNGYGDIMRMYKMSFYDQVFLRGGFQVPGA